MAVAVDQLPSDPERLRAIIAEQAAALAAKEAELQARDLLVEKLKAQLAAFAAGPVRGIVGEAGA